MKQQTAVEYLFEKLWEEPKEKWVWQVYLNKAKEMEKTQHNKTADDWWEKGTDWMVSITQPETQSFNKYYEETYENK